MLSPMSLPIDMRDTADLGMVGFLFVHPPEHLLNPHLDTYPQPVDNSLLMHKLSTV